MRRIQQLNAMLHDPLLPASAEDLVCAELYERLGTLAPAAARAVRNSADQRLDRGLALSPALAATCLLDGRRTRALVRSTLSAIREAEQRLAPAIVEVLYAGTGPLAPLALLVLPFLDSRRVRFTLLEVNRDSVRSAAALVETFHAAAFVREIVCGDATTYRHPTRIDVLISETLQRSLAEEPFVAILRNLRPQLAPGGVVIPERVTIDLVTIDAASEQGRWNGVPGAAGPCVQGSVFMVDSSGEWPAPHTGSATVRVRHEEGAREQWLALLTRVVVHGDCVLHPFQSGLTTPEVVWSLSPLRRDLTLDFRYVADGHPRLEWSRREDSCLGWSAHASSPARFPPRARSH